MYWCTIAVFYIVMRIGHYFVEICCSPPGKSRGSGLIVRTCLWHLPEIISFVKINFASALLRPEKQSVKNYITTLAVIPTKIKYIVLQHLALHLDLV